MLNSAMTALTRSQWTASLTGQIELKLAVWDLLLYLEYSASV